MIGIILAGGRGTRLQPTTLVMNKHLLPVFDRPMIFYPLCTLLLASVEKIIVVVNEHDLDAFRRLFERLVVGVPIEIKPQKNYDGIVSALEAGLVGEGRNTNFLVCLGDNVLLGENISNLFGASESAACQIFTVNVNDARRFGVVEYSEDGRMRFEEKPAHPKTNLAVIGLYKFDHDIADLLPLVQESDRGEREITTLLNDILSRGMQVDVTELGRAFKWYDVGTPEALLAASQFISDRENAFQYGCPEEVAYRNGYISRSELVAASLNWGSCSYREYLQKIVDLI